MNKIILAKRNSAIFLATLLVLGTIATILPTAQAQPYYEEEYESEYTKYMQDYKSEYPLYPDNSDYKSKDSSSSVINKIKCNNINSNNNGVDVSLGVPNNEDAIAEVQAADDEGQETTANGLYGERNGYKQNDNGFKFVCVNNNDNENNVIVSNETISEPEPIPLPQPTITCEKCFDLILTGDEEVIVFNVLSSLVGPITLEQFCTLPISGFISEDELIFALGSAISSLEQFERIINLIECLLEAGIVFET